MKINERNLSVLTAAVLADGDLWARLPDGSIVKIAGPGASDDFRNLRNASLLMYRTLTDVENWFELMTNFLEASGNELAVDSLLKVQAAVRVSRRCAIEGLENIADIQKTG